MAKDHWDKAEVIGKIAGAVLIPVVVGVTIAVLNVQSNTRTTAAQMTEIAVGILAENPQDDPTTKGPLRDWAILVLQNPGKIIPLSSAAAKQLQTVPIGRSRGSSSAIADSIYVDPDIPHQGELLLVRPEKAE